ncbi:MAG: PEP-CTERM sorting domain-containing protein [Phycisphaerae bacterium]
MKKSITPALLIALVFCVPASAELQVGYDGQPLPAGDASPLGTSYMLTDHHGGNWVDAEKSPTNSDDDLLCWAAVCANVLQWTGWGNVAGLTDEDAIFSYYQQYWSDKGGMMEYGWEWWFDGTNRRQGHSGWAQLDTGQSGGGFWPNHEFSNYYEESGYSSAMYKIDQYLQEGMGVGIAIYEEDGSGGHAITVWGIDKGEGFNEYHGLWVTDSDDSKGDSTPPDRLRYYRVQKGSYSWYLQDFYGSDQWYIGPVQALAVPEPASLTVLAMGAIALLRRRRLVS